VAKVSPFHSTAPDARVHHDNDDCPDANDVQLQDRAPGPGGLPLCDKCLNLTGWRRIASRLRSLILRER